MSESNHYIVRYVNLETGTFHESKLSEIGIKYLEGFPHIQMFHPIVRV